MRQDGWPEWLEQLAEAGRVTRFRAERVDFWVALERLDLLQAAYPDSARSDSRRWWFPDSHRSL